MAIPKHDEIQFEALKLLRNNEPRSIKDFIDPLAIVFELSEADKSKEYESGNGNVFANRIAWALSYLNMAGLVTKPRHGLYKINEQGLAKLNSPLMEFKQYVNEKYRERKGNQNQPSDLDNNTLGQTNTMTPEESLYASYQDIKEKIYQEILETILSKTPREFERLVVLLLQKMGYGGEVKDSGFVTQHTNDRGIDGIIKEDVLGFGRICIQAKKYAPENRVSSVELQRFAGALIQAKSTKGVFITTSDFSNNAYNYIQELVNIRIILINGKQLANYIFEYNLGLQTERIIEIKKLDGDFWDGMQDEA